MRLREFWRYAQLWTAALGVSALILVGVAQAGTYGRSGGAGSGSGLTPIPDQQVLGNVSGAASNPVGLTKTQQLALLGITPFASVEESTLVRAQALLGNAFDTIGGSGFDNSGNYTATLALSGTANVNGSSRSGVVAVKVTSAFAGSSSRLTTGGAASAGPSTFIDNVKTSAWYAVWRAKIATAADSAAEMEFQIFGTTGNTLYEFGARGATDTTHVVVFVRDGSGATVFNATVSVSTLLDTSWHTFEEWNDVTNLNFAIDGTIVQTIAQSGITGGDPSNQQIFVQNGATAANREIDADYMYTVTASN